MPFRTIDLVIPSKNSGPMLAGTISAWLQQDLPPGWLLNLIVVDDGSDEACSHMIGVELTRQVTIVRHSVSQGRAGACNSGAALGTGQVLVFVDADCIPCGTHVLANHLASLKAGANVSHGRLDTPGERFWAKYQQRVAVRRLRSFESGDLIAMTTANCAIERSLFEGVGGFDPRYTHYGFEDRDLLIRLLASGGRLAFTEKACVEHSDQISLISVARKMKEAGRFTAGLFMQTHPAAYRNMSFFKVDARCHGKALTIAARCISPFLDLLIRTADGVVSNEHLPYALRSVIAKICVGAAYLVGTHDAIKADSR